MPAKFTKDQFVEKSKQIHNNVYNYSLVEYINNSTKVKIVCPVHGVFEQRVDVHLRGSGCYYCGVETRTKIRTKTKENFIIDANKIHNNKYDYSLVEYIKTSTKVNIICPKHGVFEQTPNDHLDKKGCKKCANDKLRKIKPKKIIDFIVQSNIIHNNKYDYSNVEYKDAHTKVNIICPKHGLFTQTPHNHLKKHGCSKCGNHYSVGESKIEQWLLDHNIKYMTQYRFVNCKNVLPLPFDFFIPDHKVCIEFDGAQHYEPIYGLDNFLLTIDHDKIKDKFCFDNNIKLIRIPYWEKNKIKEILNLLI